MRTNIVIDDKLMKDTLRATGLTTKRERWSLGCVPCFGYGNKRRYGAFAANSTGKVTSPR